MSVKSFKLPDPGEGLVEAEIVTWKVKPGDTVKVNDIVVEIETAKSLVELPVPWAGTVTELLVPEGQTVPVGTPIISVETDGPAESAGTDGSAEQIEAGKIGGAAPGGRVAVLVGYGPRTTEAKRRPRKTAGDGAGMQGSPMPTSTLTAMPPAEAVGPVAGTSAHDEVFAPASPGPLYAPGDDRRPAQPVLPVGSPARSAALAKPPVRKYAKDHGVDLNAVTASDGRIVSRADVELFLARAGTDGDQATAGLDDDHAAGAGGSAYRRPASATGERETRIPVKGVRRLTAQAMVRSAFTAPHVTEFVTVDVTRTMRLVDRLREDPEFRDVKVSPLLVVAKAVLVASARNPGINASWDEQAQEIVLKSYVNLGIAAATPRGLVVPNIKDADSLSLRELAAAIADLTATARAGRTPPADMAGGSFTITNVGVFGIDTGTPILNPGEAAILVFGAVRQLPWVVKGKVKPRWVTQLGMSFDHRMIDGDLGSRFLADVAAVLERPSQALVWG